MKIKTVQIKDLSPHPSNPNTHPDNQLEELQASLTQFDQVKNIVVWQNKVIAGCGLWEAAKKEGFTTIHVQDVSDWSEEKAIKFMIADNRLAEIAIMDETILKNLIDSFDDPCDIPGIDQDFLDNLDLNVDSEPTEEPTEEDSNDNEDSKNKLIECPSCGHKFEK